MSIRFFTPHPLSLSIGLALVGGLNPVTANSAELPSPESWQQCAATTSNTDRLACFDAWAVKQSPAVAPPATSWSAPAASAQAAPDPASANHATPASSATASTAGADSGLGLSPTNGGCRDPRYTEVSRYYELEPGTDCGTFNFRGYRPMSVSVVVGDEVNQQPYSPSRGLTTEQPYQKHEMRLQLSARTKIASGLLTGPTSTGKDSLWFGYTQQSYWQLFNGDISRPFRTTDHEPEVFYVYPTDAQLPLGWRWRYSGIGIAHQSNGQSNPLSRSWNRWYLMTGAELGNRWQLHLKAWQRMKESALEDDNPHIQDYIGRGEVKLGWNVNEQNYLGLTARGSLGQGKGSGRIEWLRTLGEGWNGGKSNLRLHVQLFSGYGDSLVDYNNKRTVLSVGLSLLDF
ncbi:phospholipase A [Comamonas thiooxydans]|uniref:Phospholipase A1 n=1 Tax=Comamonas thiooxydans TaxID=363952 RepID=A0A0E3BQ95_9BURK|nr:phospholipase A [Comamonas thiooxydans]KGH03489.1 phospholipase [Comamonas thiooxydans]KGH17378.1 phospholipase [Comamonas thiooxydans]KGH18800.1 phospholipase [Comamonas thiooxydans]